ncbi:MAG: PTS sugar transporter subunit IIA [Clostridia bacterium]|nr:PTS sugar transporter subunit IIA [Clostridia bacterium]
MKISHQMELRGLCVGVTLKDREGIFDILAALQQKCGNTTEGKRLKKEVHERERQVPSAIAAGVAICAVNSSAVKKTLITAVTVPGGVDLDASDGEKSKLIFLVAAPPEAEGDAASRLAVLLMNENLREQLIHAADEEAFLQLLALAEKGEYAAVPREEPALILAVFDREGEGASALQLAAGRMGKLLRSGQLFSPEELHEAAGILLIGEGHSLEPFEGKRVLTASHSDSIYRPEYLLRMVEQAPIYHRCVDHQGFWKRFFRFRVPLLYPLLLAGCVLLLLAYLFVHMK